MSATDSTTTDQAVDVLNLQGAGPAVLLCEHASWHIPERYDGLGLSADARQSHAAWDPGAMAVAEILSTELDAPLIAGRVSRLVYDCNRPPESDSAMPSKSEVVEVPGNRDLSDQARQERVDSIYRPFCAAVAEVLAARKAADIPTVLVTMHSFTPVYFGQQRTVEIGILHDSDTRVADAMLEYANLLPHRRVERNEPYGPQDGVTHSLQIHGIANDLPNVMIEVRNDLLRNAADEATIARELIALLTPAFAALGNTEEGAFDV